MSSPQQLWLVSIPNRGESAESTLTILQNIVHKVPNSRTYRFEIPALVVGTLDSLMALSDELTKTNVQIEVRGVKRDNL